MLLIALHFIQSLQVKAPATSRTRFMSRASIFDANPE
ncbi:hypothetical protein [Caudoviricetes sp.]|nr:hypothetical protein [Caudoviricetes sp.]